MTIENTSSMDSTKNLVMIVYGKGGVGKTTFAASAPKPLLLDFEGGTKYLGERGIKVDAVRLSAWLTSQDKLELTSLLKTYETIVIDPLGEAMEKLINGIESSGQKKYVQSDGGLTMAGWGEAKKQMKSFIKWLRDSGKNVIIVSHVSEKTEMESIVYRIQISTKLADEIPNMVDVISYLGIKTRKEDGEPIRVLYTPAQGGNFDSKDRTGRIPQYVVISEKDGYSDLIRAMKPLESDGKQEELPPPNNADPSSVPQEVALVSPKLEQPATEPGPKVVNVDQNESISSLRDKAKALLEDQEAFTSVERAEFYRGLGMAAKTLDTMRAYYTKYAAIYENAKKKSA